MRSVYGLVPRGLIAVILVAVAGTIGLEDSAGAQGLASRDSAAAHAFRSPKVGFRAACTTATTIPANTLTKIQFNADSGAIAGTPLFNDGNDFDVINFRFVASAAGVYHLSASVQTNQGANTMLMVGFAVNGSANFMQLARFTAGADTYPTAVISEVFDLSPGDFVEVYAYHNWTSPAGVCGTSNSGPNVFSGHRVY